jgi:polyisoprenoid-binding protein YceI
MKMHYRPIATCLLILLGYGHSLFSQSVYKLDPSKGALMNLSGTSTLHDWTMTASSFQSTATFDVKKNRLQGISKLSFSLPVENLKSKEKELDKNAYKALKVDSFKTIDFALSSASIPAGEARLSKIKTKGLLTISGQTHEIEMDVECVVNNDQSISCSGTKKVKMTDYKVEPPTFLMGAMKTGDEVTLDFKLVFKK